MINEANINLNCLLVGNGFALDVYLPALIKSGINKIFINKDYNSENYENPILHKYSEYILSINNQEQEEKIFDYTIIAVSPEKQYNLLLKNRYLKNTNILILEKPIAPSAIQAYEIYKRLDKFSIKYLINYSFRYSFWYKSLLSNINKLPKNIELVFNWQFRARHFIHKRISWKKFHSQGGGAIRLYGIHLIALMSDLGYEEIEDTEVSFESVDELSYFSCFLKANKKLPRCKLLINSNSSENSFCCFYIKNNQKFNLLELDSPFPYIHCKSLEDPRIETTKSLLKDRNFNYNNLAVIELWRKIEDKILLRK